MKPNNPVICALIGRGRVIVAVVVFLALAGVVAWTSMPREEDPRIPDRFGIAVIPFPGADAATVERLIVERGVRPSVLHPLWHVAGFVLGAGTALMGERAAMACTVAVEEVIDEHYASQEERLDESESELKAHIAKFRADELEHRDIGLDHGAEQAPAYRLLSAVIKAGSRAAIWTAERV